MQTINEILTFVYGEADAPAIAARIDTLIANFNASSQSADNDRATYFDETDAVLITYGDMVQHPDEAPLQTLNRFLNKYIAGTVSGVHLLPFYPWSSDDGFSVIDYLQVDPALGDWADVQAFQSSFRLMFDAVINHISQHSEWFAAFKRNEAPYNAYFVEADPRADYSAVFRPRALPLLTEVDTAAGEKYVWTTFSADQIDLNYASPDLLIAVLEVLLAYVRYGAQLIRLDAIGFMWKELGTRCLHLPEAHALIQLMRLVLNETAPRTALVTETNVPHVENISYFGDGYNEAQMVYNFSLPPLTLHTFHTGNASVLSRWASSLSQPSDQTTFFNFCASHDGIGVTPARGLLAPAQIEAMAARVEALGGFVSYKSNGDGTQSAYELNINYMNALGVPDVTESETKIANRFLCSQAIMLALRGVPGIYFHSLFGSQNWLVGVAETGRNRTINREKLALDKLETELETGLRQHVFSGYKALLQARCANKAFHPQGQQEVVQGNAAVFAVKRAHAGEVVYCIHNVSPHPVRYELPISGTALISGAAHAKGTYTLQPYEVLWLS